VGHGVPVGPAQVLDHPSGGVAWSWNQPGARAGAASMKAASCCSSRSKAGSRASQ
jgi:hypothetical protein